MKNIRMFVSENFQFLETKFSIYLNRRLFVTLWFTEEVENLKQTEHIFEMSCIRIKDQVTIL